MYSIWVEEFFQYRGKQLFMQNHLLQKDFYCQQSIRPLSFIDKLSNSGCLTTSNLVLFQNVCSPDGNNCANSIPDNSSCAPPCIGGFADVKRYETLMRDDDDTGKYLADRYQAFKNFYEKNRGRYTESGRNHYNCNINHCF